MNILKIEVTVQVQGAGKEGYNDPKGFETLEFHAPEGKIPNLGEILQFLIEVSQAKYYADLAASKEE